MTRGNQRDVNRERAKSRLAASAGVMNKGASSRIKHKDEDAKIMQEKQRAAEEKKNSVTIDADKKGSSGAEKKQQVKKK